MCPILPNRCCVIITLRCTSARWSPPTSKLDPGYLSLQKCSLACHHQWSHISCGGDSYMSVRFFNLTSPNNCHHGTIVKSSHCLFVTQNGSLSSSCVFVGLVFACMLCYIRHRCVLMWKLVTLTPNLRVYSYWITRQNRKTYDIVPSLTHTVMVVIYELMKLPYHLSLVKIHWEQLGYYCKL